MSKKVSELTKELDITLQELKDYASKMGIDIKSANSSIEDVDASRIESTINLMRGNSTSSKTGSSKPKIKATPVINRDGAKARPAARPVIPRKAVVPPKKAEEETVEEPVAAPAEEPAAAVKEEPETIPEVSPEPAAEAKPEVKAEPAAPAPSEDAAPAEPEAKTEEIPEVKAESKPEPESEAAPAAEETAPETAEEETAEADDEEAEETEGSGETEDEE
jgi:translation initiation factor IF-2